MILQLKNIFFIENIKKYNKMQKYKKNLPPRAKDFFKIGHFSGHFYFYFFQENNQFVIIYDNKIYYKHKIMLTN